MTSSLRRLEHNLVALRGGLVVVGATAVQAAAVAMERSISQQIGADAPRRRVAGGSVGVTRHTIRGGSNPAVFVKATGPLHLLANPTKAHAEAAKRGVAMLTPYGPKSSVQHPGTKGKDTWHHGVSAGRVPALAAAEVAAAAGVRAAFKR